MTVDRSPRARRARVGWWWRVDRYYGYPRGWLSTGGWRPTHDGAMKAAEKCVARSRRREDRATW